MQFSIVIPTRNRPDQLRVAVASVLAQTLWNDSADIEIIIVDDGSDPEHEAAHAQLARELGPRGHLIHLPHVAGGHGPAFARNTAVSVARGTWIGFLDDDDVWIDNDAIARAAVVAQRHLARHGVLPDLMLSDQVAFAHGRLLDRSIWTEDLNSFVEHTREPAPFEAHRVDVPTLLRCQGFCHLNTTLVRRAFFQEIGGFDENLRYESDRDFYLRAIDAARAILYMPFVTSRHNVPDPDERKNVSTAITPYRRRLFQLRLLNKTILFARTPELIAYGRRHRGYTLKKLAEELWRNGQPRSALYFAKQALFIDLGGKWTFFTLWLLALSCLLP